MEVWRVLYECTLLIGMYDGYILNYKGMKDYWIFEDVRDVSFSPKTKSTFQLSMWLVKTLSIIENIRTHEMGIPGLLCVALRKLGYNP